MNFLRHILIALVSRRAVKRPPTEEELILRYNETDLETAAIHHAKDVINAKIEAGEITTREQLREHVLNEVAFQKIIISENMS